MMDQLKLYYTYTDREIMDIFRRFEFFELNPDLNGLAFCFDSDRPMLMRYPERAIYRKIQVVYDQQDRVLATFFLTGIRVNGNPDRSSGLWECIYINDRIKEKQNG